MKGYRRNLDGVPGAPPKPGLGYGFHTGNDLVTGNRKLFLVEAAFITVKPLNGDDGNAIYYTVGNRNVAYCHMANFAVISGWYEEGTYLGLMGDTGAAEGIHCHFAMRQNGILIDGVKFIKAQGGDMQLLSEFSEGNRQDWNLILYGEDKGFHKDLVGKALPLQDKFQDSMYKLKDAYDFRAWHYVNSGDLENYMGRKPTIAELQEFQIGPDGVAQKGGGVPHKKAIYHLLQTNRFKPTNPIDLQVNSVRYVPERSPDPA